MPTTPRFALPYPEEIDAVDPPADIQALADRVEEILSAGVFNVAEFGALGDCRAIADANITAGTAILTSATAAFTTADVGKTVMIDTITGHLGVADPMGPWQVFTILSRDSATQVTLSANASFDGVNERAYIGTDNAPMFRAASEAARDAGGGTVLVPCGSYLLNNRDGATLNVTQPNQHYAFLAYSNVHYLGLGERGAVLVSPFQGNYKTDTERQFVITDPGGQENYSFENLAFDGGIRGNHDEMPYSVIFPNAATGVRVRNCLFYGIPGKAVMGLSPVWLTIEDCEHRDSPGNFCHPTVAAKYVQVRRCWIHDNTNVGAGGGAEAMLFTGDFIDVEDCIIENWGTGVSIPETAGSHIRIVGNRIVFPASAAGGGYGIYVGLTAGTAKRVLITGNQIDLSPSTGSNHIITVTGTACEQVTISDNELTGCSGGLSGNGSEGLLVSLTNQSKLVTIKGNIVVPGASGQPVSISVQKADKLTVLANVVEEGGIGAQSCTAGVIVGNTITKGALSLTSCVRVDVKDNNAAMADDIGGTLVSLSSCDRCTVKGNTLRFQTTTGNNIVRNLDSTRTVFSTNTVDAGSTPAGSSIFRDDGTSDHSLVKNNEFIYSGAVTETTIAGTSTATGNVHL